MENIDLSSYYDKLSEIRAKVLNKNRDRPNEIAMKYANENIPQGRHYRSDKYQERQVKDSRLPLKDRAQKEANIMDRVKELDNVNQKIKLILAVKREPSSSTHQRVNSSFQRKSVHINETPKKMTSLFQNENNILESKVTPSNWAKSKEKRLLDPEIKVSQYSRRLDDRLYSTAKKEIRQSNYLMKKDDEDLPLSLKSQDNHQYFDLARQEQRLTNEFQRETFSFNTKEEKDFNVSPKSSYLPASQVPQRLNSGSNNKKSQIKTLISILIKQIELDSKLRQSKQKYHNFKDTQKFQRLKENISTFGARINQKEMQVWIQISTEECNPFFEFTQQTSFDYQELAARLVDSWDFWNHKVKESVTISGLEDEGFKIQQIDLGSKGYLTLQDFVCFLNLNSDSCFRNRDAVNMFRRWNHFQAKDKSENKLRYETFLNFVAK